MNKTYHFPLWGSCFLLLGLLSCSTYDFRDSGQLVPLTADQDASLPSIRLNGCTFHLETRGDPGNPAILFLHGGAADYKPLLRFDAEQDGRRLSDDYFLIFYDQRGKGLSQRFQDREEISFQVYLEDMEAIIDHFCGDGPVILIPHSFGGTFSINYINTHPGRIAGAVFLEPGRFTSALEMDYGSLEIHREWINDLMWSQQIMGNARHDLADFNFSQILAQPYEAAMNDSAMSPFWRIGAVAQAWLDQELRTVPFDFTTNLSRVEPEILFVAGSETQRLGVGLQEINRSFFSSSRLEVIPGAGHEDLIWARSAEVLTHIRHYLDGLDVSQGGIQ